MKTGLAALVLVTVVAVGLAACAEPQRGDPRYPSLPEGCNVQVFRDVPPMRTDNIGPVSAHCSTDTPREACLRTLKDQVCKIGGDTVWGVQDEPEIKDNKMYLYGRAAHTHAQ